MSAEIETLLAFNPPILNLGDLGRGESVQRTLEVTGKLADSVNLLDISAVSGVTLTMTPSRRDGGHFVELRATVGADAPLGRPLNAAAQVRTDSKEVASLRLNVRGNLVGEVYARPQRAQVRAIPGAAPAQLQFDVLGRGSSRFKILSARDDRQLLTPAFAAVKAGEHYRVTAAVPQDGVTGNVSGNVVVETNSKQMPTLRVPYTIIAQTRGRPPALNRRPSPSPSSSSSSH